ncbi:mannose-6-phosphate isomerase, class I [Halobacillus yeomjeoni]|uniref:Mannose-6-phosphate isomerase n=1 Tax=Halobacillus yeomjeoni TaxID=311194 RepID=A0A931HVR9_9BACI|nr:mannose-6-phosphate isomerase, class I [Halobacillus yeomjeoni]MBH0230690.1 mannose-6-phosphate isomerase, class I [Halobacillus yeomjeoni]MCA0985227.1 mannose-6-phosphate isomerase, class I [Halobacillus yeomjeoni]
MYKEPIFLKPEFKERIWGGTKLNELFHYDIPSDQTGEAWCISGHANGPNTIQNGPLKGKTLAEAWDNHRELFADEKGEEFPLLVKILDSKSDLSVQVHPNDTYAREVEGQNYGKTECWYVIDCEEGAEIIFGHHASDRQELEEMVEKGEWDSLLRSIEVHPGDFFYVPSGTIHAIGGGIQILETQQSSDITYRVYDYDRVGDDGKKRELHLEKSLEVTNVPHKDPEIDRVQDIEADLRIETLIEQEYFSVFHYDLEGRSVELQPETYLLFSVLEGDGEVKTDGKVHSFEKGDHFIIPSTVDTYELEGNASFIVSRSNKN